MKGWGWEASRVLAGVLAVVLAATIGARPGDHEGLVVGSLIGARIGAHFTVVGSLSTVFWLSLARQRGAVFGPAE